MAKKYVSLCFLLILYTLLFGCSPVTPTVTAPQLSATQVAVPTSAPPAANIVDLVDQRKVTFRIISGAINELGLQIRNTTDQPLQVEFPSGTYFVNKDPKSQNMVVLHPASVKIDPKGSADVQLDVACANLHLIEPTKDNSFTIQRTPNPATLMAVLEKLNSAEFDFPVEQAAVWIVTDDATFDELGMLVKDSRFGTSVINETDAVQAMMLVDDAGLAIQDHAIWRDISKLLGKVSVPPLSSWLDNQYATKTVVDATQAVVQSTEMANQATQAAIETTKAAAEATQAISEATQTIQAFSTPIAGEISQYAIKATASSQYSDSTWSAMQAVGEPNTSTCGDNGTAWASLSSTGSDWLMLTYDQVVLPKRIVITETYNPGAIAQVELLDQDGKKISVYRADPSPNNQCPNNLVIDVSGVDVPVNTVLLTLVHSNWSEIDAVQLIGVHP